MRRKTPDFPSQLEAFGIGIRQEVDGAVMRARSAGQAGHLDEADDQIASAVTYVKRQQLEIDQMKRRYAADAQAERVQISGRGRMVTNVVGHGIFGNALRGGAERSRGAQRAQLSVEQAEVRTVFQSLKLDTDDMLRELAQEQRYIKEIRSRRH